MCAFILMFIPKLGLTNNTMDILFFCGTPVGTTDLVSSTTERVSQLGATSLAAPRGHLFADVDVAREHAVKQRLVSIRVNL